MSLLQILVKAFAYTPEPLRSQIVAQKLLVAALRAILTNCWTVNGIMDPAAHQSAYDVNEPDGIESDMPTRTRLIRMANWCKARTAPPEVCTIQLIDAKLTSHSVVTPSFVGGVLVKNATAEWTNATYNGTPIALRGTVLANGNITTSGVAWSPTSSRSEFAVVKDGACPAYISFRNAR